MDIIEPSESRITKPAIEKLKAVEDAQRPSTKKEMRSFLGLLGYYRKFVPNFAKVAAPLPDLTKKVFPISLSGNKSVKMHSKL